MLNPKVASKKSQEANKPARDASKNKVFDERAVQGIFYTMRERAQTTIVVKVRTRGSMIWHRTTEKDEPMSSYDARQKRAKNDVNNVAYVSQIMRKMR